MKIGRLILIVALGLGIDLGGFHFILATVVVGTLVWCSLNYRRGDGANADRPRPMPRAAPPVP